MHASTRTLALPFIITAALTSCSQLETILQSPVAQCAAGIIAAPPPPDPQQYLAVAMTVPACRTLTEMLVMEAIGRARAARAGR